MMFTRPSRARTLTLVVPLSLLLACSGEENEANDPSSTGGSTDTGTSAEPSPGGSVSPGGTPGEGTATGGGSASGDTTAGVAPNGMTTSGTGGTGTGGNTTGGMGTGDGSMDGTSTDATLTEGDATELTSSDDADATSADGETIDDAATGDDSDATSSGGASSGETTTDDASAGGDSTDDTGTGGSAGGSALADQYPCDGDTSGYDAVVTGSGNSWSVNGSAHGSLFDAVVAAFGSGGSSASDKRTVLLQDSGEVSADVQMRIPSNTVFNACGTINVDGSTQRSDRSPCYARDASNIDIPHITITGAAQYGCFFRDVDNVHIGVADIRLDGGLGMRFDNHPSANDWTTNSTSNTARRTGYQLDDVYVEGASHGVEFYGIEDITIGRVVARNTSQAGLMLNNSRNIEVGLVDGQGVSPNAGYAVFRMANDNGKDWDTNTHPMSIHVGKVIARESGGKQGRGIFCLTDSGGVTIGEVDIEDIPGNSIWLESCTNVVIGNSVTPSRIHNSGDFTISYGTSTRMSNDLVFENIAVTGTNIDFNQECPPNFDWINVTHNGSAVSTCE